VTEYKKIPLDNGMVLIKPFEIPFRTYMICKNREYDIPLYVSVAVGKLFKAQAYRSAIYSAHMAEIDKAMSFTR
ncbi:MAG: hypothetical protein J6W27_04880, partial [Alphaproteobacteria bacterium]|nr:hypothetical protein [Alphaproteobacteria bacterium]